MAQDIDICLASWEHQGRPGYVFLSKKSPSGAWSDKRFAWPGDKEAILTWFKAQVGKGSDLYWCPAIFRPEAKGRRKEGILPGRILYSDLDPVDPREVPIRPTVAWESSPGRFQALWWVEEDLPAGELEGLNKRLTYSMEGADKGGWDLTQVLRIPNLPNHKYNPPAPGKLLWGPEGQQIYHKNELQHLLLLKEGTSAPTPAPTTLNLQGPTLVELLSKYRKQIPPKVSRMLQYPPSRVEQGKRSDILWYIESELVKAQVPQEDIIRMVGLSAWNKYRGRSDEWTRLTTEISRVYEKALEEAPAPAAEDEGGAPAEDPIIKEGSLPWKDFAQVMSGLRSQPGWLIKNMWLRRSHGIVAGEPKCFKSIITLDMAVSIASGKPLWDEFEVEEQGPVMIIQNENADWIIRDRLEKIVASRGLIGEVQKRRAKELDVTFAPELPIYFLNNFGYNFSDPLHREALESMIRQVQPVLLIFDPLYLMFDGEINSAKELQPILFWLLELKNKYSTGVMVVHHWNKNGSSSRGGQRMLGSTTLHGWTESGLFIERKVTLEGPDVAAVTIEREFRAAGLLSKLDLQIAMGDFGEPAYRAEVSENTGGPNARAAVIDLLSMMPGGMPLKQAAKELKITPRKLSRMLNTIREVKVDKSGRGAILKLITPPSP